MYSNSEIGLILCGGNSSRMGSDKGLLQNNNQHWSRIAFDKAKAIYQNVYISINHLQSSKYNQLFNEEILILDNPDLKLKGPLVGIISAHVKFPDSDILVLACDMTEIQIKTIQKLKNQFSGERVICYSYNKQPEPLLGIYPKKVLKSIYRMYTDGKLLKFSMMHILELVNAEFIELSEQEFNEFKNINSPEDLIQVSN